MKKLISLVLCFALLMSLSPAALADDEIPEEPSPVEESAPVEEAAPVEEPVPADEPSDPPADEPDDAPAEIPADDVKEDPPADAGDGEDIVPAAEGQTPGEDEDDEPGDSPADENPDDSGVSEEEQSDGEEAASEDENSEESETDESREELLVAVRFVCDPEWTSVTVYTGEQLEDGSWKIIDSGLTYELVPGEYVYDAVCEGYVSQTKVPLELALDEELEEGKQQELKVSVTLQPEVEEEGALDEEEYQRRTTPPEPLIVLPVEPDPERGTPTVFLQRDSRWGESLYLYSDAPNTTTIGAAGCGILALTNAVYYLNGIFIDPVFGADYSTSVGCHVEGGTRWDFYRSFAENYGLDCGIQYVGEVYGYEDLKVMLRYDCAAICSIPGHFMTIVDYDENLDRFLLLDSSPDDLRATGDGYVWISEEELGLMPSRVYECNGLVPRFVMLRAVGTLDVNGLLDGEDSDALDDYGTFDVWIDGDKVADDQTEYSGVLRRGVSYRIDDIRAKGAHRYLGVGTGALEGSIHSGVGAEVVLSFGTKDFMAEAATTAAAEPAAGSAPVAENTESLVCTHWAGGVIGPSVSLPRLHG